MTSAIDTGRVESVIKMAQAILAEKLGGDLSLRLGQKKDRRRSWTMRCFVEKAPPAGPSSVFIKCITNVQACGLDNSGPDAWRRRFNPDDLPDHRASLQRFRNEWTGWEFLCRLELSSGRPLKFFGGDALASFVILEDLGDGSALADLLTGQDPYRAEQGLMAFSRSLGRLHAATAGEHDLFRKLQSSLKLPEVINDSNSSRFEQKASFFLETCKGFGISISKSVVSELRSVGDSIENPGPFLAFSPGDTCPDNNRLAGEFVHFFDFENSSFKHCLLDAAVAMVPFPTCWCANRLPETVGFRMIDTYRVELAKKIKQAQDDSIFWSELLRAWAWWIVSSIAWDCEVALVYDGAWGLASHRQRHIQRLAGFAKGANQLGDLIAIGNVAGNLASHLRQLWSFDAEMPLYPAFRDS